jgi:hypothetical protein
LFKQPGILDGDGAEWQSNQAAGHFRVKKAG